MKSSSRPTILVSVVLAVGLWLAATLMEDDSRWLPPVPGEEIDTTLAATRADTPLRANTDVLSCGQVEENLTRQVGEAQSCSTDDDCTLFDFGYPIQCMTSVAKSEITALRLAYRDYEKSCAYRVYYDCPSGELERQAVCRNNRCAVELVGSEPLQDETLQHIGIKDL
ncbi:MAG: hypothetical protein OEW59_05325 [Gammaproteobacteria bacterium]|nr:hypothetical protein [Gammaproteobacteria bacterium]